MAEKKAAAKKAAAKKPEETPDPAAALNPAPLVSTFGELKEEAAEAVSDTKKKG